MTAIAVISALLMLVGIVGIVVPVLPGLFFVWLGVLLWSVSETSATGWAVLSAVTVVGAAGIVLQYLIPGQRMRAAGVKTSTMVAGVVVAILCGIAVPVVGAVVGFPLGIYAVQRVRRHEHQAAWRSTVSALRAIGLNILIELATALVIVAIWVAALTWWT
ncbi:MAG TPA: DUF456 domain-containing protein [Ornithinimicrobium sp.]|uniref:DUF456 domain-containing protein n=1 Tax=Ornithinimicrobium sp. TaxID=1977084 RepID=UPI002B46A6E1|nr:DUF456 domain-containing protein [Ornithinimicrobium sp.]HKJ12114.1 DUF456 domain-containing protein [Ornithinimicrobium sp.]